MEIIYINCQIAIERFLLEIVTRETLVTIYEKYCEFRDIPFDYPDNATDAIKERFALRHVEELGSFVKENYRLLLAMKE